jgi:hypothetical protein
MWKQPEAPGKLYGGRNFQTHGDRQPDGALCSPTRGGYCSDTLERHGHVGTSGLCSVVNWLVSCPCYCSLLDVLNERESWYRAGVPSNSTIAFERPVRGLVGLSATPCQLEPWLPTEWI